MTDPIGEFLGDVRARLEHGAREYGDQSFVRPVAITTKEILEEQVDQVGWCYVLWAQAARKTAMPRLQAGLQREWLTRMEHRIRRGDRGAPGDRCRTAAECMAALEILAMDLFLANAELRRRLLPIARAIEVVQVIDQTPKRKTTP